MTSAISPPTFDVVRAVNHILTAKHGKRIAIIENEFGEVGVDDGLAVETKEEIFEMNNGCICCTVRQTLSGSSTNPCDEKTRSTTSSSKPPVWRTRPRSRRLLRGRGSQGGSVPRRHPHCCRCRTPIRPPGRNQTGGGGERTVEQIAFADKILLNKIDLLKSDDDKASLVKKIRSINARAAIIESQHSAVDIDYPWNQSAQPGCTLEQDAEFLDTDAEHQHDESVTSVGIEVADAAMDITKLKLGCANFLAPEVRISSEARVFSTSGTDERHVFQGVHMMMEMSSSAEGKFEGWGKDQKRVSRVIFIGRNLDRSDLNPLQG